MAVAMVLFVAIAGVAGPGAETRETRLGHVQAEDKPIDLLPPASFDWGGEMPGPLCGVYAASTALELIGVKADPRDYVALRFVGQCGGSSAEEVARIIADAGAEAHIMTRLSALDLRMVDSPVIANVRSSATSARYNHWVVAVPDDRGVMIYDGLQEPYVISIAAFLGSWSGIGICVTRHDVNPLTPIWLGRSAMLLTIGIAAVVIVHKCSSAMATRKPPAMMCLVGLLTVSAALAIAGNSAFGDLLHHREGVAIATASSHAGTYRRGTLDDAYRASRSDDMLLVDARREVDFHRGALDGAVNIPVTSSSWSIQRYLQRLDRSVPIVVYCQSARCGYDEAVASQLESLGFTDVTVCDQGWLEYQQTHTKIPEP